MSQKNLIQTLVGDQDIYESIPVISIPNGTTDYLDRVKECMFPPQSKWARGESIGRPFLTLKVHLIRDHQPDQVYLQGIITIFQRYSNEDGSWAVCPSHFDHKGEGSYVTDFDIILECGARIHKDNQKNFENLVQKGEHHGPLRVWDAEKEEYTTFPATLKLVNTL